MRPLIWVVLLSALIVAMPASAQCVPPAITTQPQSAVRCVGDSVTFSVTATGSHPDIVWHKDGFDMPGPNAPVFTIDNLTHADAGVYRVELDNPCGFVRSDDAILTIVDPPTITSRPAFETKCVGDSVTFRVTVAGGGPYRIEWSTPRSNKGTFGPPNAASLTLDNLTAADAGAIFVRVTNACSKVATATGTLEIREPPVIMNAPHGHAICPGGSISLEVTVAGTPPFFYQWYKDGALIPGEKSSTLRIFGAGTATEGLYSVAVSNGCGNAVSLPVPLVLAEPTSRSWAPLGSGMNGPVLALQSFDDGFGSALYAGGAFTTAGGVPASRVARWKAGAWEQVGDGMNAAVHVLGVFDLGGGPALYAAGEFTMIGALPVNRIAKWNGIAWQALGSGIPNGVVRALHVFNSGAGPVLHAGGTFTMSGPLGALAAWDGLAWSLVGNGLVGSVHALEVFDEGTGPMLFLGGSFSTDYASPPASLMRWDGAHWLPSTNGSPPALVRALLRYDDGTGFGLYVGGDFQGWNGINGVARWSGGVWSPLGVGLGPGPVYVLASYDDGSGPALYAGGNFTMAGLALVNRIARWQNQAWSEMQLGRDDLVRTIAIHNENGCADLYTGGFFSHAGGMLVNFVARWKAAFTLELSQPLGNGSLAIVNAYGNPLANYFAAFSFDPANATTPGGGPWFGLFITGEDLLGQFAFGAPPFVGTLDQIGTSIFLLPAGTLNSLGGTQAWGLTVIYDPVLLGLGEYTNVESITFPMIASPN